MRFKRVAVLAAGLVSACSGGEVPARSIPIASANDNRTPAGTRTGDTLRIDLVATMTRWYPETDSSPFLEVAAFAEEGSAPLVPGPLIRVSVGTTIQAAIHNTLSDTLLVVGLSGPAGRGQDTLRLAPGARGSVETLVRLPGSFAYYGHTLKGGKIQRHGPGEWLFGAFVVDSLGAARDRIFVIKGWNDDPRFVMSLNGKSWPHTERLTLNTGDTLRLRVINGSDDDHPMHLHGFYYHVDASGTWHADTSLTPADRKLVVTETLRPTQTMSLSWVPTRPGNWLFHCHDPFHTDGDQHDYLAGRDSTPATTHHAAQHAQQDMAGLVLGIVVRGDATVGDPTPADRKLRVQVRPSVHRFGRDSTTLAYTLDSANGDSGAGVPGPVLELHRGERTAITVVNRLTIPTAVHWHGIELESYYDGVAGWSGSGSQLAPLIMPTDSFVAVMTPPRAGTFIYHAHADDENQIGLGLAGPLLVLERGVRRNSERDHVWMFHWSGVSDSAPVLLNGAQALSPLQSDVPHRIRVINITVGDVVTLELQDQGGIVTWRALAKDGADLPHSQATTRPARLQLGPGETWDFLWTPARGRYTLKVDTFNKFDVAIEAR